MQLAYNKNGTVRSSLPTNLSEVFMHLNFSEARDGILNSFAKIVPK